ncbi:hypothetical protein IG631_00109 [Alternaria alternata]|nr:hypothetical protein IG631_00109 [Alternaria alternata]
MELSNKVAACKRSLVCKHLLRERRIAQSNTKENDRSLMRTGITTIPSSSSIAEAGAVAPPLFPHRNSLPKLLSSRRPPDPSYSVSRRLRCQVAWPYHTMATRPRRIWAGYDGT